MTIPGAELYIDCTRDCAGQFHAPAVFSNWEVARTESKYLTYLETVDHPDYRVLRLAARDDVQKQIIVAFRGSQQFQDDLTG